jgi:hypothetical protein
MDDELVAVARNENDDLEQVAGAIWADDQPSIGFLAEVVDDESVAMAWVMSSSSTPWRRADRWISTRSYRTTKSRKVAPVEAKCHAAIVAVGTIQSATKPAARCGARRLPPSRALLARSGKPKC